MNISRKSWHYRLADFTMDFFSRSPSDSLCIYFWQVVLSPFILIGAAAIILIAIFVLSVALLYGIGCITNDLLVWAHVLPESFKQLPGVFNYRAVISSLLIELILVLYFLRSEIKNRLGIKERTEDEEKEQNFVVAFIKAKKQKICPFITFKD